MSNHRRRAPSQAAFVTAQGCKQLFLPDGFLQDCRNLPRCQPKIRIAGHYDDANALIVQPLDKTVGQLASSQIDINEGRGGDMLGGQLLGLGRRRGRSDHLRSQSPKKPLHRYADLPGILDQKDTHTLQIT
jgi:hypothetical protein